MFHHFSVAKPTILDVFRAQNHHFSTVFPPGSRAADTATLLRAAAQGATAVVHHRAGDFAACPGWDVLWWKKMMEHDGFLYHYLYIYIYN